MPSWIGWPEIVVLAIIALVIFGPRRLPELGHSIGKAITGFRKGLRETELEVKKGLADDGGEAPAARDGILDAGAVRTDAPDGKENKA